MAGGLPYKSSNGDALHLSLGCKLQILASLRVFGMESYYRKLFAHSGVKVIYKKCCDTDHTEISFRGQFKLESHPHWSPLGV